MKKLISFLVLIMLGILTAKAQKGSTLIALDFGLNTTSFGDPEGKSTSSDISFALGYQFNNHWTAGGGFGYSNANSSDVVQEFSAGPFIRYTKEINSIFSLYGQCSPHYFHLTQDPEGYKTNGFGITVIPAVFINIKNGFGLNLNFGGLSYLTSKSSGGGSGNSTYKNFNLNFGQGAYFGVSKNFGGTHKS